MLLKSDFLDPENGNVKLNENTRLEKVYFCLIFYGSNADVWVFIRAYYWILAFGLIELQHDSFYTQDTRFQTDLPAAYRQPTVVENINFQLFLTLWWSI